MQLGRYEWGRELLSILPDVGSVVSQTLNHGTAVFATTFTAFGYFLFILFTFLFVTFEPRLYRRGLDLMVPPQHRRRAGEVLDRL